MSKKKTIRGSGGGGKGGGGGGRTPVEDRNSLRSRAYAQVIDLISEGEIEGLVDGNKSIFFDETPLENEDGSLNFSGIEILTRNGTQGQSHIPGFASVENEIFVNVKVVKDQPITRTITNENVDAVRVRISTPQLTSQDTSTGDIKGHSVEYKIELQSDGGGFSTVIQETITGKTTSKYQRSHRIDLTGDGPWDVRITRLSDDDAQINYQSSIYFDAYTEVIDAKLRYPNSALAALKVDSSQFNSVPRRAYEVKLLKIRVPSNYDPETRVYTGSWDGTFQTLWSDNPAWVFYDMLTNDRYGLGTYISEDQVDKWSLYSIGRYCDELVPDGFGGFEPRFTCNIYFQSQQEAFKVLQDLSSVFRAMSYWATGSITVVQDSPADALALFTQANVEGGTFTYQGSSAKARHTVALVTWNDPEDFYRQKVEYVEDPEAIERYGYIPSQVYAVGCSSRGQAHRLGKWIIYTEKYETETVTFKTGLEGALLRPGAIIQVADRLRAGQRMSGRIVTATTTAVTIDSALAVSVIGGDLACMLPDGSVETKTITSVTGQVIQIDGAFTAAPQAHSIWMAGTSTLEPQTFRVLSIAETDGGFYEVNALSHNPDKYAAVERDIKLQPRSISALTVQPAAPQNLQALEELFETASNVRTKVTFSWDRVDNATSYSVQYKQDDGNFILLPDTINNEVEILDITPGLFTFKVVAINAIGKKSATSTLEAQLYGKTAAPSDVEDFSLIPAANNIGLLSWTRAADLDVVIGGQVRIRWTPATTSQEWNDSIDVIPAVPGSSTTAQVPLLAGTYLAKFVDSSGNESENESLIVTNVPQALELNVVEQEDEHPDFLGSKTDCEVSLDLGGLVMSTTTMIDDIDDIDEVPLIDWLGPIVSEATYLFENTIDLGAIYPCRLTANINVEAFDVQSLIDLRTELIDSWSDIDGDIISDVNATLYMRTTDDDPGGSPDWSEWKPFLVGEYPARGFQFKVELISEFASHNIIVKALSVTIDMPDRVEGTRNITSGTSAYSVTFVNPFWETPSIGVTAHNLNTGDFFEITNQDATGFDILFKNSGGTNVSRQFDWLAKGYGRELL